MNSITIAARPIMSAISKRSIAAFSTTPVRSFEKAHHQVAPLTDSTIYAPQGHTAAASSTTSTSVPAADTTVIFSPTVNHVFDD